MEVRNEIEPDTDVAPGPGYRRASRTFGHRGERHLRATRVPASAELLPRSRRLDSLRLPADEEDGHPTVGVQYRLRRRLRRAAAEALAEHPGRQLRMSRRIEIGRA